MVMKNDRNEQEIDIMIYGKGNRQKSRSENVQIPQFVNSRNRKRRSAKTSFVLPVVSNDTDYYERESRNNKKSMPDDDWGYYEEPERKSHFLAKFIGFLILIIMIAIILNVLSDMGYIKIIINYDKFGLR